MIPSQVKHSLMRFWEPASRCFIDYVWKLAYGKGALSGVLGLVSSGFDCWGPPVRLGSDSEIWVIKFKAKNQENQ